MTTLFFFFFSLIIIISTHTFRKQTAPSIQKSAYPESCWNSSRNWRHIYKWSHIHVYMMDWACRTNVRPVSRPWGGRWRREYFYFLFGACGMCIWYYLKLKNWKNLLSHVLLSSQRKKLFFMYMYLRLSIKKKSLGIRYTWV